jgi:hypothetical protein
MGDLPSPGIVLDLGKDDGVMANHLVLHGLDNGDDVDMDHDRCSSTSSERLGKRPVCESVSATFGHTDALPTHVMRHLLG